MDESNLYRTLRDEIAIAAMATMVQSWPWPAPNSDSNLEMVARDAYRIADAMLKAREVE